MMGTKAHHECMDDTHKAMETTERETETNQNRIAQRDKLEKRIWRCYHFQENLSSNDRRQWFDQDIKDKLNQDPQHLSTWLLMTERLIRIAKRENKK
jgi:hypothetical protein